MTDPLDVLLVEPWYGGSHRTWADGLVAASRHRVRLVSHPPGPWRWRVRGGSVTLARAVADDVAAHGPPDVVLVSGLVDLAGLLGQARRSLGGVPVGLYLHETQAVVPWGPNARPDDALALVGWTGTVAADRVWFNSRFHREAFLAAVPPLLDRIGRDEPHHALVAVVAARAAVLAVGFAAAALADRPRDEDGGPPIVLWNHRWDHDKDPRSFFHALVRLGREGVPFRVAVAGENVRPDPRDVTDGLAALGERVVHVGHLPRADYEALLGRADVVVSTARHELFGVAVAEAIAAGAVPVLPRRQAYPDLVPARWHPAVLHADVPIHHPDGLVEHLRAVLADLPAARRRVVGLRDAMRRYDWSQLGPVYDRALGALAGAG